MPWAPLENRGAYLLEDTPLPDLPEWAGVFASSGQRILFLVDCQTAAHLINGAARLMNDSYTPLMRRSCHRLKSLWTCGWMPRRDESNYVAWVPRSSNATADFLANIALQNKEDFVWTSDQTGISGKGRGVADP